MADRIILCTACGTQNRVSDWCTGAPKCGSCGADLGLGRTVTSVRNGLGIISDRLPLIALIGLIATVAYFASADKDSTKSKSTFGQQDAPAQWRDLKPVFSAPPVIVSPGLIQWPSSQAVAPLGIRTSPGHDYFVKLVNSRGATEMSFFVRGGQEFETKAPLGTYELRYASGKVWYGTQYLFGPDTVYSKADSVFHFTSDGLGYNGYTVELIMQNSGNLRTSRMSPSNF